MEKIAGSYAQALFELAIENNSIQKYKDEFQSCIDVFYMDSDFIKFLKNPVINKEEKKQILKSAFEGKISKELLFFFYILVDKSRIAYIKEIYRSFDRFINEYNNVENAIVYSVVKVEQPRLVAIKEKLQSLLDQEIIIENKIDKSLIAGIKIVVGNRILDQSLKAKITNLNNELLDIKF